MTAPVNSLDNLAISDSEKAVNLKSEPVKVKPAPVAEPLPSPVAAPVAEEPIAAAPAPAPAEGKKKILPNRSGIGSLLKEVKEEISVKRTDEHKVELNSGSLPELWKSFLDDIRHKAQASFLSVADSQQPELREETIIFSVPNKISLEMLQLHKSDIMSYFISKTTAKVQLDFQLVKQEEHTKTFRSAKERLREMAAANDAVNKLIQKFDLNLD